MNWLVTALAVLYCLSVVAAVILFVVEPERWWVALLNAFAPLLFLPLALLLPVALVSRSPGLRVATIVTLAIFVLLFGRLFVPGSAIVAVGTDLRVATLNQRFDNRDTAAVLAAIRSQRADLVAVQELSPAVAQAIEQQFAGEFPYRLLDPSDGPGGLGVISRYPLKEESRVRGVRSQRVTVDLDGRQVQIVNVHVHRGRIQTARLGPVPVPRSYDTLRQYAQARSLAEELGGTAEPLIVLGDFNASDRDPAYAVMAEHFRDAYRATTAGFGFTFPNRKQLGPVFVPFPLIRIDYVWTNQAIVPAAAKVVCDNNGADHCMLVANLVVQ